MKLLNTENVNIRQFAVNFLRIHEAYIALSDLLCSALAMNFTTGNNTIQINSYRNDNGICGIIIIMDSGMYYRTYPYFHKTI